MILIFGYWILIYLLEFPFFSEKTSFIWSVINCLTFLVTISWVLCHINIHIKKMAEDKKLTYWSLFEAKPHDISDGGVGILALLFFQISGVALIACYLVEVLKQILSHNPHYKESHQDIAEDLKKMLNHYQNQDVKLNEAGQNLLRELESVDQRVKNVYEAPRGRAK